MSKEISNTVIVRYLSGECTIEEKKQVEDAMKSNSSLHELIVNQRKIWNAEKEKIAIHDIDLKWREMERMIRAELQKSKAKPMNRISDLVNDIRDWFKPAAAIRYAVIYPLLLISAYFLINNQIKSSDEGIVEYNTVSVYKGKRKTVSLKDGTIVTLDAGSKLKYPVQFGDTRDVYLVGEAYFEVAKDPVHPFRVHVNNATVKVVGTKFNIRAWDENPKVTVTVVEGKVLLSNNRVMDSNSVFLTRGKQGSVSYFGEVSKPVNVNSENYIKWIHNEIFFKDANLREILSQLERWYGYEFTADDSAFANQKMTVHIRNVNVREVINIISKITKTKIVKEKKHISFLKKK